MRATASVVLAAVLGVLVVAAAALTIPAAGGVAVAFLAAVVGAELLAAARDDDLADPVDAEPFRISTPVHLAAMIVAGPWVAALAGVFGVLASRLTAPRPTPDLLARAVSLGVAGLAGGYAYVLAGSDPGTVVLPDDLLGVCVVVTAYAAVRTIVDGLAAGLGVFPPDARTLAGEGGLALVLAVAADQNAWRNDDRAPVPAGHAARRRPRRDRAEQAASSTPRSPAPSSPFRGDSLSRTSSPPRSCARSARRARSRAARPSARSAGAYSAPYRPASSAS